LFFRGTANTDPVSLRSPQGDEESKMSDLNGRRSGDNRLRFFDSATLRSQNDIAKTA